MTAPDCVDEPRAPFPWFGGKRRAAPIVWGAFGNVGHYVEPFCGSCAVLLARPRSHLPAVETVNDADGMIANAWRAMRDDPDAVAARVSFPVAEIELHARLASVAARRGDRDFVAWLEGSPDHRDAALAADWLYCVCASIGAPFDPGPWVVADGRLVNGRDAGRGVNRELPHVANAGQGVNRRLLGNAGRGVNREASIRGYLRALSARLERVRVCCGDWRRVLSDTVLYAGQPSAGVLLDPPYTVGANVYAVTGDMTADVRAWAAEYGARGDVRIALCGYADDGHDDLLARGWRRVAGRAGSSGYGAGKPNRELIWLSPHCLAADDILPGLEVV